MPNEHALRVLIVDDEPLARRRLRQLLDGRADVASLREAENGREAVRQITEDAPDLVFLDVQMPGLTGVDVIRDVGAAAMPPVVFVTAYDQYALEAFRLAALDYLVKPFDDERFEEAFARARRHVHLQQKGATADRLLALLENERPPAPAPAAESAADAEADAKDDAEASPRPLERIAVETPGRLRIISVSALDYITADGSYAELHLQNGKRYPIRERMKTLERRLDPDVFFRIHRSTIVRLSRVVLLHRGGGGRYTAELEDGTRLSVSRSRQEALQERLGLLL